MSNFKWFAVWSLSFLLLIHFHSGAARSQPTAASQPAADAQPTSESQPTTEAQPDSAQPANETKSDSTTVPTDATSAEGATADAAEPAAPAEPTEATFEDVGFTARQAERLDEIETVAYNGKHAGDNAWMLVSSALVLFMTAPGLAMFYSGLVRKKNVLSVMMQCIFLMGLMTVIWGLWGYSLSFGGSNPYIGNGHFLFMNNVSMVNGDAPQRVGLDIPELTFMVFQGMFFIITPALICGAFAERMKFSTMVVFMILWGTIVYCPLAHWVWGEGILYFRADGVGSWAGGALDFAGGTVVHISSGVSALICALLIGKRLGLGSDDMRPHNLTYTALGAGMLWVGWFGFNAGSAGAASGQAANALVVTHFSAAAGALVWAGIEWLTRGKPSVLGAASGAVAGLVCITPASGYVQPMPALVMGAAAGLVCYYACSKIKATFGYDDSLDAFGVHGVGGTLGAVLTGVFATTDVYPGGAQGLFYDTEAGLRLMKGQIVAVAVTWVFAGVVTFILLKVLDVTMGLRVSQEEETRGLDITQHGEEGYI